MAITKPTYLAPWATSDLNDGPGGSANKIQPPLSKQTDGWNYNEIVPRNWWNYQLNNTYQWLDYFSKVDEGAIGAIKAFSYNPELSSGLTFVVETPLFMGGFTGLSPSGATDSVTLTANATNFVCVELVSGLNVVVYTSEASIRPGIDEPLYRVVTNGTEPTSITDYRNGAVARGSIRDWQSASYVERISSSESTFFFQREGNTNKSVGWRLEQIAADEFATLETKSGSNVVMTLNLTTDSVTIHDNATLAGTLGVVGPVTLTSTLEVDGSSQFDGAAVFNSSATFNGTVTLSNLGNTTMNLTDNTDNAFVVQQGTDKYIEVDTTNGSEQVAIGNALADVNIASALLALTAATAQIDYTGRTDVTKTTTEVSIPLANGLILKAGTTASTGSTVGGPYGSETSYDYDVTFATPFPTACVSVLLSLRDVNLLSKTVNGFDSYAINVSGTLNWLAIGY